MLPIENERREHPRVQWVTGGRIDLADNGKVLRCLVHNLSLGGARLTMLDTDRLPETIKLCVTPWDQSFHECRVVWRSKRAVGVAFLIPLAALPILSAPQDNIARHGPSQRSIPGMSAEFN